MRKNTHATKSITSLLLVSLFIFSLLPLPAAAKDVINKPNANTVVVTDTRGHILGSFTKQNWQIANVGLKQTFKSQPDSNGNYEVLLKTTDGNYAILGYTKDNSLMVGAHIVKADGTLQSISSSDVKLASDWTNDPSKDLTDPTLTQPPSPPAPAPTPTPTPTPAKPEQPIPEPTYGFKTGITVPEGATISPDGKMITLGGKKFNREEPKEAGVPSAYSNNEGTFVIDKTTNTAYLVNVAGGTASTYTLAKGWSLADTGTFNTFTQNVQTTPNQIAYTVSDLSEQKTITPTPPPPGATPAAAQAKAHFVSQITSAAEKYAVFTNINLIDVEKKQFTPTQVGDKIIYKTDLEDGKYSILLGGEGDSISKVTIAPDGNPTAYVTYQNGKKLQETNIPASSLDIYYKSIGLDKDTGQKLFNALAKDPKSADPQALAKLVPLLPTVKTAAPAPTVAPPSAPGAATTSGGEGPSTIALTAEDAALLSAVDPSTQVAYVDSFGQVKIINKAGARVDPKTGQMLDPETGIVVHKIPDSLLTDKTNFKTANTLSITGTEGKITPPLQGWSAPSDNTRVFASGDERHMFIKSADGTYVEGNVNDERHTEYRRVDSNNYELVTYYKDAPIQITRYNTQGQQLSQLKSGVDAGFSNAVDAFDNDKKGILNSIPPSIAVAPLNLKVENVPKKETPIMENTYDSEKKVISQKESGTFVTSGGAGGQITFGGRTYTYIGGRYVDESSDSTGVTTRWLNPATGEVLVQRTTITDKMITLTGKMEKVSEPEPSQIEKYKENGELESTKIIDLNNPKDVRILDALNYAMGDQTNEFRVLQGFEKIKDADLKGLIARGKNVRENTQKAYAPAVAQSISLNTDQRKAITEGLDKGQVAYIDYDPATKKGALRISDGTLGEDYQVYRDGKIEQSPTTKTETKDTEEVQTEVTPKRNGYVLPDDAARLIAAGGDITYNKNDGQWLKVEQNAKERDPRTSASSLNELTSDPSAFRKGTLTDSIVDRGTIETRDPDTGERTVTTRNNVYTCTIHCKDADAWLPDQRSGSTKRYYKSEQITETDPSGKSKLLNYEPLKSEANPIYEFKGLGSESFYLRSGESGPQIGSVTTTYGPPSNLEKYKSAGRGAPSSQIATSKGTDGKDHYFVIDDQGNYRIPEDESKVDPKEGYDPNQWKTVKPDEARAQLKAKDSFALAQIDQDAKLKVINSGQLFTHLETNPDGTPQKDKDGNLVYSYRPVSGVLDSFQTAGVFGSLGLVLKVYQEFDGIRQLTSLAFGDYAVKNRERYARSFCAFAGIDNCLVSAICGEYHKIVPGNVLAGRGAHGEGVSSGSLNAERSFATPLAGQTRQQLLDILGNTTTIGGHLVDLKDQNFDPATLGNLTLRLYHVEYSITNNAAFGEKIQFNVQFRRLGAIAIPTPAPVRTPNYQYVNGVLVDLNAANINNLVKNVTQSSYSAPIRNAKYFGQDKLLQSGQSDHDHIYRYSTNEWDTVCLTFHPGLPSGSGIASELCVPISEYLGESTSLENPELPTTPTTSAQAETGSAV